MLVESMTWLKWKTVVVVLCLYRIPIKLMLKVYKKTDGQPSFLDQEIVIKRVYVQKSHFFFGKGIEMLNGKTTRT